jgi:hypothetical protein
MAALIATHVSSLRRLLMKKELLGATFPLDLFYVENGLQRIESVQIKKVIVNLVTAQSLLSPIILRYGAHFSYMVVHLAQNNAYGVSFVKSNDFTY